MCGHVWLIAHPITFDIEDNDDDDGDDTDDDDDDDDKGNLMCS